MLAETRRDRVALQRAPQAPGHALVHVGDGVARGFDQRVAAALGLADLGFEPAQGAAGVEVGPFVAYRLQQLLRLVAQGDLARAGA